MKKMTIGVTILALFGMFFPGECCSEESMVKFLSKKFTYEYFSNIGAAFYGKDKPAASSEYAMTAKRYEVKGVCVYWDSENRCKAIIKNKLFSLYF